MLCAFLRPTYMVPLELEHTENMESTASSAAVPLELEHMKNIKSTASSAALPLELERMGSVESTASYFSESSGAYLLEHMESNQSTASVISFSETAVVMGTRDRLRPLSTRARKRRDPMGFALGG